MLRQKTLWSSLAIMQGVLVWMTIAYLSLTPATELPPVNIWDKALHSIAWWGTLLSTAIALHGRLRTGHIAVLVVVYSSALEIGQNGISGRHFSIEDIYANLVGIALGWLTWQTSGPFIRRLFRQPPE